MKAGWVDLNNNVDFWKLEWFNESQVPKSLLSFSRNVPWIQERLLKVCAKDLHKALLGVEVELTLDKPTESNLEYLIWSARAKLEAGDTLDTNWLNRLESAAGSNPG